MENTFFIEFADLARTCNFQESAENMFVSTSTLSKHIRKMEEELGVPLFDRSTRTVSLSKFGAILLPYAEQIAKITEQYTADIQSAITIADNHLNIGFLPMLGRFGVLELLSDFSVSHPSITMNIMEGNQLEELLLSQKFDFVFVDSKGPNNPKIEKLVLKTDRLVAIFPQDHPLAAKASVTIDQLRNEKFILQCTQDGKLTLTAQDFLVHCQESGFEANVALTTRYITTIARFIEQGKGIGILYSSEILDERQFNYAIVDIEPFIPFDICVSYQPGRIKSEASIQFLNQLNLIAAKNRAALTE